MSIFAQGQPSGKTSSPRDIFANLTFGSPEEALCREARSIVHGWVMGARRVWSGYTLRRRRGQRGISRTRGKDDHPHRRSRLAVEEPGADRGLKGASLAMTAGKLGWFGNPALRTIMAEGQRIDDSEGREIMARGASGAGRRVSPRESLRATVPAPECRNLNESVLT